MNKNQHSPGLKEIKRDFLQAANPERAKRSTRFFKTGKGEYGEGDKFLGLTVPQQRKLAKKYQHLSLIQIKKLLSSQYHDHRLTALLILVQQFSKADRKQKKQIYNFYLDRLSHVNNWDLVDLSAPKIIGEFLLDKPNQRNVLYKLAKSKDLWKKRIAILATARFIKQRQFNDTLKIAEILLNDEHDLIHKAVGWMLREIGKTDQTTEEKFLQKFAPKMPRTMLRYAIEKFSQTKRRFHLEQ